MANMAAAMILSASGWGQQTPALQFMAQRFLGRGRATTRRRRRRAATSKTRKRRTRSKRPARSRRGIRRLVKGSPAAKRYMARLRKMRRR